MADPSAGHHFFITICAASVSGGMEITMKYVEIPYVKKKVSRILYGTAMPPFMNGEDGNELLDAMYALGINTFDTARVYGGAE